MQRTLTAITQLMQRRATQGKVHNRVGAVLHFSSRSNWLDGTGIVVFQAVDARAHRPTRHPLGRVRREQRLLLARFGWFLAGASTTGIRLCSSAQSAFGGQVTSAKLRTHSPAAERQFSHNPASAMMPRSASAIA
ncbi:MAG TPA: hypothetical protein VGI28_13050 [Stellaceae bacterium]|jgi:hypothetical protein